MKKPLFTALFIFFVLLKPCYGADTNFRDIRQLIEYLQMESLLPDLQEPVYNRGVLMDLYQSNKFKPLWDDREYKQELIAALEGSSDHGLMPQDYHVPVLKQLIEKEFAGADPRLDVLLTDGLLLYSHHLLNGKLNPKDFFFSWNFPQRIIYRDSIDDFLRDARRERTLEDLTGHSPSMLLYRALVEERKRWDQISREAGTLTPLLLSVPIKPGESSPEFGKIIQRMEMLEFIPEKVAVHDKYDSSYLDHITRFQMLHGLVADGILGNRTIRMLNMPIEERIAKIDINLERLRWLSGGLEEYRVYVNIAGFHLYVVRDQEIIWDTPVMTGAVDTQTPIFMSQMKYLVFNPTWTVPRGILKRSLFAKMKADPDFLPKNNYVLLDRNGNQINPATIDWETITLNEFGYTVVQNPGPGNAMGVVKFMFPNEHAIYLHDTPSKALFSQTDRAFSNGCIRVKDPLVLARILLNDERKYNDVQLREIVQSKSTRTVFLKEPVSVILAYLTVDIDADENVIYYEDVYRRDPLIIENIRKPLSGKL